MSLRRLSIVFVVSLTLALGAEACKAPPEDEPSRAAPSDQAGIPEPPAEAPPSGDSRLRTVYVPAYSHLPTGKNGEYRSMLSILLSVRNMDTHATITLTHVDYFDTPGNRVRRYLREPRALRPLETAEFLVETEDEAGGSGANFLVYWEGPEDAHPLLTEAVMIGNIGSGYMSFTSRGVELDRRPEPSSVEAAEASPHAAPGASAGPRAVPR